MVADEANSLDVLPAYAGMIRFPTTPSPVLASAPRVCGDDPWATRWAAPELRCSPRMRG